MHCTNHRGGLYIDLCTQMAVKRLLLLLNYRLMPRLSSSETTARWLFMCTVSGWSLPLLSPNNWRMRLRKLCRKYFTLSCDVMQRSKNWVILVCKFCTFAGDITQKGYDKKRLKLLTPYLATQKLTGSFVNLLLNKIYTDVMLLCKLQLYTAALPCRSW